jgi:prolyl oligopeptidase
MSYPPAQRQPVVDDLHGHLVADPYRWLEDPADPSTTNWLAAQDELWREHAARLPGRDLLHDKIARYADTGTTNVPMWRGNRCFYIRQSAGQEHAALYTAIDGGAPAALVDPVELDPSGLTTLDLWQPDQSGELLAYQISHRGTEKASMYVREVATGRVLDGPIEGCRYSPVAWLAVGSAFYYVRTTGAGRLVYLHRVGTPADSDVVVFGADRAPNSAYGLEMSADGRWLSLAATRAGQPGNDLWLADLSCCDPAKPELRVVQEGVAASTVCIVGGDGRMYVFTNRDAPRGAVYVGDPARPDTGWRTLIEQDSEAVLTNFALLDGKQLGRPLLLVNRQRHALSELTLHDLADGVPLAAVPAPGAGTIGSVSVRPEGGHEAWFSYTDSLTPITIYRYDARTGECGPVEEAPDEGFPGDGFPGDDLPSDGFSGDLMDDDTVADRPLTRQLVCTSKDGTEIRMVVCAQPGATGPRPAILYGYGGFGTPLTPSFSGYALAWVQAGGVFVTANLRGGGEGGEEWHRAGTLERKQNTFDDFYAVADHLIAEGWTTPEQLGITGESNGGLLVGAAITQRPELFAAAACSAPVLDMARYELSGYGPSWRTEYGSPADPKALGWLLAYSPYHNVVSGVDYPAVLFTVFDSDTRVDPMHARKMCAAMQTSSTSGRPVLLRQESDAGHAGKATSKAVALAADLLAFLALHTGLAIEGSR